MDSQQPTEGKCHDLNDGKCDSGDALGTSQSGKNNGAEAINRRRRSSGTTSISIPVDSLVGIIQNDDANVHYSVSNKSLADSDSQVTPTDAPKGICDVMKRKHHLLLKGCLVVTLLLIGVVGAIAVYIYTSAEESAKFEYHFSVASNRVQNGIQESMDAMLSSTDSMAVAFTSYAQQANLTWPNVTIPNFYLLNRKYAKESKSVFTAVYHYVEDDQRAGWEEYAATHNQWIDEDLALQKTDPYYKGYSNENPTYIDFIFGLDDLDDLEEYYKNETGRNGSNRKGPFMPSWQCAPIASRFAVYNWDKLGEDDISILPVLPVLENNSATVSAARVEPDSNDKAAVELAQGYAEWFKDFIGPDEDPMEPVSDIYYPIYKENQQSLQPDWHLANHTLVGLISSTFQWRHILEDLGHGDLHNVDAVFRNKCNPTFTYRIGSNVEFLGKGDRHEKKYDDLEVAFKLEYGTKSYTGVAVDPSHCPFEISLYPAPSMHEDHTTFYPGFFSALTAVVLALVLLVFTLYDWQVGSRQRRTNRNLKAANLKLKEASYTQLKHFAMMSHEIRTPLNGILGMASLLESDENSDNLSPGQKECIDMILRSGDLLRNVVDDVLDYSKLLSGNHSIEVHKTNLQDTLSGVLFSFEKNAQAKNITLETVYDIRVPAVLETDGRRLQQILFNLISNAIKFSPEGETVILGAILYCRKNSTYGQRGSTYPYLRIYVEDHGKGIDQESYDKIFEPFQQAAIQTERLYGGTGLGLSITKKLVHALGGKIMVKSEVGKYAKFIVDFPLESMMTENGEFIRLDNTLCYPEIQNMNFAIDLVCSNESTIKKVSDIFRYFKIEFYVHSSLTIESFSSMSEEKFKNPKYTQVFLIDEDLLDMEMYNRLQSNCHGRSVTFTFGRKFAVGCGVSQRHFRSLEQIIPAAFILAIDEGVKKASLLKKEPSESNVAPRFDQLRVLIAEDNLVNQKVITRMLSRIGVETVRVVGNGKEAVEAEAEEPFDVVLMDREMPLMDGLEACKRIQQREESSAEHSRAPIVFLTAHVTGEMKRECLDAGAVDFLSKPCNIKEVTKCLADIESGIYLYKN